MIMRRNNYIKPSLKILNVEQESLLNDISANGTTVDTGGTKTPGDAGNATSKENTIWDTDEE
jgi:hypothetical protein